MASRKTVFWPNRETRGRPSRGTVVKVDIGILSVRTSLRHEALENAGVVYDTCTIDLQFRYPATWISLHERENVRPWPEDDAIDLNADGNVNRGLR